MFLGKYRASAFCKGMITAPDINRRLILPDGADKYAVPVRHKGILSKTLYLSDKFPNGIHPIP